MTAPTQADPVLVATWQCPVGACPVRIPANEQAVRNHIAKHVPTGNTLAGWQCQVCFAVHHSREYAIACGHHPKEVA